MTEPHRYRVAGLSVQSEIALPGAIPVTPEQRPAEVTIRLQSVMPSLAAAEPGDNWQIAGDRMLLRIPEVGRFLLTAGRTIGCEPEPGAAIEDIAPFLVGTVFGALLHQRGQFALHASAVEMGGRAVLFCGPSGAGKSTLAAALGKRGYPLVADDLCAVSLARVPKVQPDGRLLKLWSPAIEALELDFRRRQPVHTRLHKSFVEPEQTTENELPIGTVYLLRESGPAAIEQAAAVDAVRRLIESAFRPAIVQRLRQRGRYFEAAASIAQGGRVFHFTRFPRFADLPQMIDRLVDHWAETRRAA